MANTKIEELESAVGTLNSTDLVLVQQSGVTKKANINQIPSAQTGEANTASNHGLGVGVFTQKIGVDLEFKSIHAGDGINVVDDTFNEDLDVEVKLDTTPGLEFNTGTLRVKIDSTTSGLERVTAGIKTNNANLNAQAGLASGDLLNVRDISTGTQVKATIDEVIQSATLANDQVTNAMLANMAVNTVKARVTAGTGDPEDITDVSLTEEETPETGDKILGWSAGVLRKFDVGNWPSSATGEANTASNLGLGVGVFETKVGVDLRFNSLIGADGIVITEDDANDEIDVAVELATDPGLEFATGLLRAKAGSGITVTATGINANVTTVFGRTGAVVAAAGDVDAININMQDSVLTRPQIKDYALTENARGSVSGAQTVDLALGNAYTATLTGNATFSFTNMAAGYSKVDMILLSNATGGWTLSFTGVVFATDAPAAMLADKRTRVVVESDDGGTNKFGFLIAEGY